MLEVTGPRLSPAAAEQVASRLLEAMTRTRDSHQLARLARGLRAVGAGLSAAMSERAAEWLVEVMTRRRRPGRPLPAGRGTGGGVALAPGGGRGTGVRDAVGGAERLCDRAGGPQSGTGRPAAPGAGRRPGDRADRGCHVTDQRPRALETLTRGLQAVVPRLTASATARAAEQLAAGLLRTRVAVAIRALADGLCVIAQRLPAADVERFVERAADRLIEAMFEAHEA